MSWYAVVGGVVCALASVVTLFWALVVAQAMPELTADDDPMIGWGLLVSFLAIGVFCALGSAASFGAFG